MPYGPPIKGAPWNGNGAGSLSVLGGKAAVPPSPPITPPTPGRPSNAKPFIERYQDRGVPDRLRRHTEKVAVILNSLLAQGYLVQVDAATYRVAGGASVDSRSPTATDDASKGIPVGGAWVDSAAGTVYFCVDNTINGAIWKGPF